MKIKDNLKRVVTLLLAFILTAVPLTACGGKGGDKDEGLSEFVYVPQYTTIPKEVTDISNPYFVKDTIYFTSSIPVHADGTVATQEELDKMYGNMKEYTSTVVTSDSQMTSTESVPTEPIDITYKTYLFSINKDGTNYNKLADYSPKETSSDQYSYVSIDRLIADTQGNVWIAESVSKQIFNLPEGFDSKTQDPWQYYVKDERKTFIRKLSATGAEISSVDISQYFESSNTEEMEMRGGQFYINDMIADTTGNIYISDGNNTVYVINADGSFLFKLSVENYLNRLVMLKDGKVGATSSSQDGKNVLKIIDTTAKAWGTEYKIPMNAWDLKSGGNQYDFCYTDSSSLFGYNLANETSEKILTWLNCDVDGNNVNFSTVMDDGNVFALSNSWDDKGSSNFEIITLKKTPRSEVKQKTTLTLATMWLDYNLRKELLKFNKTNENYRIEITDYSEFNTEDDYTAGITKLNTEIISGNVPDLIDISQLPYQQYAAKGLLEDLYPYIDRDYKREDFIPSIMKAAETDGKLYLLTTSFSVNSIVGSPSVVGNDMGWTMDEMQAIVNEHPEADYPFGYYMSRDNILQGLCMLNMGSFMNWQTGECSFNSDDFKKLLTFAKTFPEKMPEYEEGNYIDSGTLIQDGRQLFEMYSASDFQNYQYYKAMFGGAITFKGFPTGDKKGNVAMLNGGLAMTTSCKDKDGAWQFMSSLLSEDYQENLDWNYPISQKAFDKKLAEAMKQEYTTDESGNKIPVSRGGMSMGNGPTVEFYAITQEEADQIKALINSVERTASYDENLLNIISEEAAYFFSGEKTVDETADIIQSRMNIYINEQR